MERVEKEGKRRKGRKEGEEGKEGSTPAVLGVHQLPCQSVGDISQGRERGFIQVRAVAEPWVRYRASFCPTLGPF